MKVQEKMTLMQAVECGSLKLVKEIVASDGLPKSSEWLDYDALNFAISNQNQDIALFLLDQNCRVNKLLESVDPHDTPLHHAVKTKDKILVAKLLEKNVLIDVFDSNNNTPLHSSFLLEHFEITNVLLIYILETSNYVNPKNTYGLSHMHIACTRNKYQVVEGFLKLGFSYKDSTNENSPHWPNYNALNFAIEFQSVETVRTIIDFDKSNDYCDMIDTNGFSPFDIARTNFEEFSVMVYLLSGDSGNEDRAFFNKMSKFHLACLQGSPECVCKFINNNAAVNNVAGGCRKIFDSYSPLHYAVASNCKRKVEILLKSGVNVHCKNGFFMTPLHLALYNENYPKINPIVDLLYDTMKNNMDKNVEDINGLSYLHVAITRNDISMVKKFLSQDVKQVNFPVTSNEKNFTWYISLHFAIKYERLEMAKLLIAHGADIQNDSDDGTPLHMAFHACNLQLIELLFEKGAKAISIRNSDNKTMVHSAVDAVAKKLHGQQMFDDIPKDLEIIGFSYVEWFVLKVGYNINFQDKDGNTALHLVCEKIDGNDLMARCLLALGADINLENSASHTPFECCFNDKYKNESDDIDTLYNYIQKLKALGLKVNCKNEVCCKKVLEDMKCRKSKFELWLLEQKSRAMFLEIEKMKQEKITRSVSLYNFMKFDVERASNYVDEFMKNETLKEIIESQEVSQEYPIYSTMIELFYREARKHLESVLKSGCPAEGTRSSKRKRA